MSNPEQAKLIQPYLSFDLRLKRRTFSFQASAQLTTQWTTVFGPSASGKSTLLRILAGLESTAAGMATKGSLPLFPRTKDHRIHVGLVTQHPALFPHMTVQENIEFGLNHLRETDRQERTRSVLEQVKATHLAQRKPLQLSGGEMQRIALARTLAPRPSLLLLDEYLSALDAKTKQALSAELHEYSAQSSTVVLSVTHDLAEALSAPGKILRMEDGHVAGYGDAATTLGKERESLLALLLGESNTLNQA